MTSQTERREVWVRHRSAWQAPSCAELVIAAGAALLGTASVAAAGEGQGVQIAAACASCHDPAGGGQGIPKVDGLDEKTLIRAMQAFRASGTPSHVMHAVALSLTDEEVASVARYLASRGDKAGSP